MQNKIESYYTRGRQNNIDCFYLSRNYNKTAEKHFLPEFTKVCCTKLNVYSYVGADLKFKMHKNRIYLAKTQNDFKSGDGTFIKI
jgi:hypothetical protein